MQFFNLLADIAPGLGPPIHTTPDNDSPALSTVGVLLIVGAVILVGLIILFIVYRIQKNKPNDDSTNKVHHSTVNPTIQSSKEKENTENVSSDNDNTLK